MKASASSSRFPSLRPGFFTAGRVAAGLVLGYWAFVSFAFIVGPGRCWALPSEPYQCSMPLMMPAVATAPTSAGLYAVLDMVGTDNYLMYVSATVLAGLVQGYVLWILARGPRVMPEDTTGT